MTPLSTCSWTRWQSNSICLVHLWNIGLDAIWIVAWLFQYIVIGNLTSNFISSGSCVIYISLHDVFAMALYSAFALDQDTTLCFLLLLHTLNVNLGCLLPFFPFDLNQLTLLFSTLIALLNTCPSHLKRLSPIFSSIGVPIFLSKNEHVKFLL